MDFLKALQKLFFGAPLPVPAEEHEPGFDERYYAASDGLELYYRDYPCASEYTPVLCIPGLTRNARDFEFIAAHIAQTRRVLVADLRGRGKSAYTKDHRHYSVAVEAADMMRLLDDAGLSRVIVLGTSRGGIVAMAMAATRRGVLQGAILNDIGGEIEARGLARILEFIGREPPIPDWNVAAAGLQRAYAAAFPNVSDRQWMAFARAIYRDQEGKIVPDYDPRLGDAMRESSASVKANGPNLSLWPLFSALGPVPTLVLRGAHSDLLSAATVTRMATLKSDFVSVTIPDRGHVPFLDEPEAVAAIDTFLARGRLS